VADEAEGAGHRAHLPDVQVDSTHQGQLGLLLILLVRVADPHYFNADPDQVFLNLMWIRIWILFLIKVMAGFGSMCNVHRRL
jgi:hypothetical protein